MPRIELSELRRLARKRYPGVRVSAPHYLSAWAIHDPGGELARTLDGTGVSVEAIPKAMEPLTDEPKQEDKELITACITDAAQSPVSGSHLLLAICNAPRNRVSLALKTVGLNLEQLRARLNLHGHEPVDCLARHAIGVDRAGAVLQQYCRELTTLAKEGSFDDLYPRPEEIDRIFEVLLRRQKRNGVLTGPAGVGKTALVELFARDVAHQRVPAVLRDAPVFEMSVSRLVAGTKYRGQFEERLENLIAAIEKLPAAVLFIDEIHMLVGAGRAEGIVTDGGNILKRYLDRGRLRVLGATTVAEYHRFMTQDQALARRFQEIRLKEPDADAVFQMVSKQAEALAVHHELNISHTMVERAIGLTNRYMRQRRQPDKAVEVLDSASAVATRGGSERLTESHLFRVVARQTGRHIPESADFDSLWLTGLAERLKSRIVGQEKAIEAVARTLLWRSQDVGSTDRCLGAFLFAGDTGVGKTEMGRSLAAEFFQDDGALLHIDLAEYCDSAAANKLIGAAAGYVGSERDGMLIDWLHTRGSGVLLFDEVEKCHPDVRMLLLGLLDNGRITGAKGETMDATGCVLVFTTNAITSKDIKRGPVGFGCPADRPDPTGLLSRQFPSEFLGRFDEIVFFNVLGEHELRQIVLMRLSEALERLERQNVRIAYDEGRLVEFLGEKLKAAKSGARGIARVVEKEVLQPIAFALLNRAARAPVTVELGELYYTSGDARIV